LNFRIGTPGGAPILIAAPLASEIIVMLRGSRRPTDLQRAEPVSSLGMIRKSLPST
jgi:hypothetical protein